MNLNEILENINYIKVYNEQEITFNNVKTDTREIEANDMFVGIKGKKFDGNTLFKDAYINGANICVLEYESEELIEYLKNNKRCAIIVKDTIKFLGELAKYKRSKFVGNVIAITGSSGKTSTKDMLSSILSTKYKIFKTEGNLNNHIGLPLTILNAPLTSDFWILEMGMNHLKEISYLSKIAEPNIAVISNVGISHIGNLGSRKNILKAKLEILDGLKKDGLVFINNDNDLLSKWAKKNNKKYNIKTIGIENISDYNAKDIKLNEEYSEVKINTKKITINVGGIHFIYNALMGYALGKTCKLKTKEIQMGINNLNLSKNRMNIINKDNIKIIDDSYNSNYDSCKYSLKFLGNFAGRKIAVLGTMKELGKHSKKYHKLLGNIIVDEKIDVLITVGEYSHFINKQAEKLGFNKEKNFHYSNNIDAINKINEIKKDNDIILVKASNSMKFREIVEKINI